MEETRRTEESELTTETEEITVAEVTSETEEGTETEKTESKKKKKNHCEKYIGIVCKMPEFQLPTNADVLRHFEHLKPSYNSKQEIIAKELTKLIIQKWWSKNIPIFSENTIARKIVMFYKRFVKIRNYKENHKIEETMLFINSLDMLFDVAQCPNKSIICHCDKYCKVADNNFLFDQRNKRLQFISEIDLEIAAISAISVITPSTSQSFQPNTSNPYESESFVTGSDLGLSSGGLDPIESNDDEYQCEEEVLPEKPVRPQIKHFVMKSISRGTSNKATADEINFHYMWDRKEEIYFVYPSRVFYAKEKARKTHMANAIRQLQEEPITSLYFDSKIDYCFRQRTINGIEKVVTVKVEQYTLLSEPDRFVGAVSIPDMPEPKKSGDYSKWSAKTILEFLQKNKIPISGIEAIGADGCRTNTGRINGIIRQVEIHLSRPVQWFICILHMLELTIKNLMVKLVAEGKGCGPDSYGGILGQAIRINNFGVFKDFKTIACPDFPAFSSKTGNNLRTDQELLYDLCQAVVTGKYDHRIQSILPGPISPARWLTTAIRILLLYLTTEDPSSIKHLVLMTNFVVKSYAPCYFEIKKEPLCQNGTKHYFNLVRRTRYLDGPEKKIVDDVLRRNSFWAHPENVLIAMLADHQHRERAIEHIQNLRATNDVFYPQHDQSSDDEEDGDTAIINAMMVEQGQPLDTEFDQEDLTTTEAPEDSESDDDDLLNLIHAERLFQQNQLPSKPKHLPIRIFEVQKINLDAADYTEICDWQQYHSEPPLTLNKDVDTFVCPRYLCHNQNVERSIRVVSRESRRTYSEAALNGNLHVCREVERLDRLMELERERLSKKNFGHWSRNKPKSK